MTTQTPALDSALTLAKTGTCSKRPAMIAYAGKETVLLVLQAEGNEWSEIDRSPHSGIRGLGQMMKKLDKDSARNPSDAPAWADPAAHSAAQDTANAVYVERVQEVLLDAPGPLPEELPADPGPLAAFFGTEVAAEVAATTDLSRLRALREQAAASGAPADVVRAISLRAGEVVLGIVPGALKRKPVAKVATERAPRPEGTTRGDWKAYAATVAERMKSVETLTIQVREELEPLGFGPSWFTVTQGWSNGCASRALAAHGLTAKATRSGGTVVAVISRAK